MTGNPILGPVVIVGAGHAGGSAAAFLRQYGYEGRIVLIGDEPIAPYQRPPLSKAYLKGESDAESLKLRPDDFYVDAAIEAHWGTRVEAIDRSAKVVQLQGGETIAYGRLILATGSRARRLPMPGADLKGVHAMRTLADAEDFKSALGPGKRLLVVGGGYIGLEAAASARALGADAIILEREGRCLQRVASQALSTFFEAYHRARGVEIRTRVGLTSLEGDEHHHVVAARLADGETIPCTAALIGVGGEPIDELALAAGLDCDGGVVVDHEARTSDPDIFAIGDVTRRPLPVYGDRMMRLESVPNALEQAKQAASAITGHAPPPPEVPWFWSDQFDIKLQIAGVPFAADDIVVRGDPTRPGFAVYHLEGTRIRAVEAVNSPPDFMWGKQQIARPHAVDKAKLADPGVPIKTVLA